MATIQGSPHTEDRWLACLVDKGMFSDEMAVTYPPEGDMQKSVFVAAHSVQGRPGEQGRVRVRVMQKNGSWIAVLPSAQRDIVYVRPSDITDR